VARPASTSRQVATIWRHMSAVFASLTCLQSRPPARLFSFETARRAAQPAQACLRWGRRVAAPWKDSASPDSTTNNQTHLPQDRQNPRPDRDPGASRLPSHRPGAFTPRCTGRATARARCHARCWALRSPHAPAFGLVSFTFRPEARKEVGASVRKVLLRFNNPPSSTRSSLHRSPRLPPCPSLPEPPRSRVQGQQGGRRLPGEAPGRLVRFAAIRLSWPFTRRRLWQFRHIVGAPSHIQHPRPHSKCAGGSAIPFADRNERGLTLYRLVGILPGVRTIGEKP